MGGVYELYHEEVIPETAVRKRLREENDKMDRGLTVRRIMQHKYPHKTPINRSNSYLLGLVGFLTKYKYFKIISDGYLRSHLEYGITTTGRYSPYISSTI